MHLHTVSASAPRCCLATDVPHLRWACCKQNLVDSLAQRFRGPVPVEQHSELNTFVVYNVRSRVTSSAKRRREPGSLKVHQTPDGSFLDLMRNAHDLLQRCGWDMPQVGTWAALLHRPAPALLHNAQAQAGNASAAGCWQPSPTLLQPAGASALACP